ncbi:hypothetical protein BN1708_008407 [Verticillium longisporum]|uniref:FAD-binding domain-containing protein n=1 Tax=Verticillium longisporum TaxID=100787 RepID=A0A0G4N3G7_VERLO|nr:hypothetical protein BN1708_008407 [Verticillium longisporum]
MASNPRHLIAGPRFVCRSCTQRAATQNRRSFATAAASNPDIYDVVCVGGGPAGLSLLAALRSNPTTSRLRVALVEAQDLSKTRNWTLPADRFSNRCSSLTPTSAQYLNSIGAWSHMKRERIQVYQEMQVWDGVTDARIEFDWTPDSVTSGGKTIAYMCENLNLTSGLLKRLEELGGVSVFDAAKVQDITLGEETEELDLSQWPVVHLEALSAPSRTSRVAAGLPGKYSTLVWSTTPANAALLKSLAPKDFIALVNAAFRLSPVDVKFMHTTSSGQDEELQWRLDHTPVDVAAIPQTAVGVQEGTIASFPLKLRHADTYIGERVALIGDAAHTIHPLAGQGLNSGQGDVQSLAKTIEYAVAHGQDIGSSLSLETYNSERYAANHVLLGVCDKLHKLYSVESGPLVHLRSLGLNAVNAVGPLKKFIMDQAAGSGARFI